MGFQSPMRTRWLPSSGRPSRTTAMWVVVPPMWAILAFLAPLLMVIGQDAANELDSWHEWRRLFDLAHIVVMRRPESRHAYSGLLFREIQPRLTDDFERLKSSPAGCMLPLEVTQLAISSTGIRAMIAAGHSPRFLLPDAVIRYVAAHSLYRARGEFK